MLYDYLAPYATGPILVCLFIVFVGLVAGFQLRGIIFGKGVKTLDGHILTVYTPGDVKAIFDKLKDDNRKIYAWTQVTLDIAFPLVYGAFMALLIICFYQPEWARWLVLIPCVGAGADVLENLTAAVLAWRYTGEECSLSWVATAFTFIKWTLVLASLVVTGLIVVFGVAYKVKKMKMSRG